MTERYYNQRYHAIIKRLKVKLPYIRKIYWYLPNNWAKYRSKQLRILRELEKSF